MSEAGEMGEGSPMWPHLPEKATIDQIAEEVHTDFHKKNTQNNCDSCPPPKTLQQWVCKHQNLAMEI